MKNLFKILVPSFIAISLMSCMATTATDSYGYNDSYNQGYSNGYMDGYYRSPDGNWYAPGIIYSDYNGNSYRNGNVYRYNNTSNNNSQRSVQRNAIKVQPQINTNPSGIRTQNNIRVQPNTNSGVRNQSQNNIRVQPQNTRVESQNNVRVQPQIQQNNNSQRSNGSR